MKRYYVDFNGYLTIEAENADEAVNRFWEMMDNKIDNNIYFIRVEEVEEVEEAE